MSKIHEQLVVHCPYPDASRYLAAFVADHRASDDGEVRIASRLPLRMFADRRSLSERQVVATLHPVHPMNDAHPLYSVSWSRQGGPFPEFSGALSVQESPTDDRFGLTVSGDCEPPLGGPGGALLDAALGRRIARASARDLLRLVAVHVEHARAHNDAARAALSPLTHLMRGREYPSETRAASC